MAGLAHQHAELGALRGKSMGNMMADKSGSSGDKYLHRLRRLFTHFTLTAEMECRFALQSKP